MAFFDFLTGGVVKSLENVASEWIETSKEEAEAKAVMIKALDPNGKMRRDLSRVASRLYVFYMVATTVLIFLQSFGIGDVEGAKLATQAMTDLFLPLTTAWGGIVTASFGINHSNNWKDKQ